MMTQNSFTRLYRARFGTTCEAEGDQDLPPSLVKILRRRTHRQFTDQPVSDELMEVLLACALSAPSKSDLQQVSIVRISDPEKLRELGSWIPAMPWVATSPEFLVFCADQRRMRRVSELRGHEFANDNLDGFVNATIDASLALQTFMLAAEAVDLGCCAISAVRDHIDRVSELLELPAAVYPIAGLCVGYPSREGYQSLRLPPELTTHVDRYDDDHLADAIDGYDQRRDAIFPIPKERYKYREVFGDAEFYSWSEDKARQESRAEREGLRSFLESRGFSLE